MSIKSTKNSNLAQEDSLTSWNYSTRSSLASKGFKFSWGEGAEEEALAGQALPSPVAQRWFHGPERQRTKKVPNPSPRAPIMVLAYGSLRNWREKFSQTWEIQSTEEVAVFLQSLTVMTMETCCQREHLWSIINVSGTLHQMGTEYPKM